MNEDEIVEISGNRCPRGEVYARQEVTNPVRIVATSVKVEGGVLPLVSVKTDQPIPRHLIPQFMDFVKSLSMDSPITLGQILAHSVLGTGANLIATRAVATKTNNKDGS
jgi:CxxC motif-containing protein